MRKGISLAAKICGEMNVNDVPVAGWADMEALKDGDDDPLEVIMAVPAGKSTRGWNYTSNALNSIVGEVNSTGLPGFLGHQKSENVATEFPTPVTHWIGAKMENGTAYFRGLIDKSATDLKRWIRGKAINQVSIFGYPQLEQNTVTGETDVIDYKGLSIDWTPLNRAGMPTSLIATSGEMDVIAKPADESHEALREALRSAAYTKFNTNDDTYISISNVYDDYFIAYCHNYNDKGNEEKYYKISYAKGPDNTIVLGEPIEVRRKETWEPVTGEMRSKGKMKKEIKDLVDTGKISTEDLRIACGEMGITLTNKTELEKVCGEIFEGRTGEDLIAAIRKAGEVNKKAKTDELIDKILKEKVTGEMAQGIVKKMLHIPAGADEKTICGEIDSIINDDFVKSVLAKSYAEIKPPTGNDNNISDMFVKNKVAI